MKKILFTIICVLQTFAVFCQSFEGRITSQSTYISKNAQLTDQQLASMMGTEQEYYIKGGDYRSVANGTLVQWQLYVNEHNKLYSKMSNSETVFWNDGSVNPDSVISFELNKEVLEILGYMCDELILTCVSGIQKYYFSPKLKVDISLFEKHQFGNWYDYLKLAGSLPLKAIVDSQQFTLESIATEVKEMKLKASDFQLRADAKTAKSPY